MATVTHCLLLPWFSTPRTVYKHSTLVKPHQHILSNVVSIDTHTHTHVNPARPNSAQLRCAPAFFSTPSSENIPMARFTLVLHWDAPILATAKQADCLINRNFHYKFLARIQYTTEVIGGQIPHGFM